MAIQVGGTTVIDNSRNLSNVGGLKTVGGNSILGSGNITTGGSTTYGAVGTYTMGRPDNKTTYSPGDTASGVVPVNEKNSNNPGRYNDFSTYGYIDGHYHTELGGTWRSMNGSEGNTSNSAFSHSFIGLWVRIS